jgi:hypothetical protein
LDKQVKVSFSNMEDENEAHISSNKARVTNTLLQMEITVRRPSLISDMVDSKHRYMTAPE